MTVNKSLDLSVKYSVVLPYFEKIYIPFNNFTSLGLIRKPSGILNQPGETRLSKMYAS